MDFLFGPIEAVLQGLIVTLKISEGVLITWLITGGWLYAIRGICFFLDTKLVNFISYVYKYFMMILNGDMFNQTLVDDITKNIYIFIGVVVFFRLMMLVIKYLINPDLVSDAKAGATALIQRCVIGMAGIIFIPTLFNFAFRLQDAILEDQIIQKLIIPNDALSVVKDNIDSGGKFIGTYVLAGFLSPSSDASGETTREYATAIDRGDITSIDVNRGGFLGSSKAYEYEYFVVASTFVLCYVFYQMLKYTIDLAVRAFKLLLFQIMAPIAMVEYMISGSDDGMFKSWKKATLSTYCMVFVRVMAIWFVVFVTMLMSGKLPGYANGSLLAEDDNLLRAIIIIALLGFMMDLPKIVGQVFGLDLEQESSATGILKQVGGMIKGAAIGALTVGGAAVGGAIGTAKAVGGVAKDTAGSVLGATIGKTDWAKNKNQAYKDNIAQKATDKQRRSEAFSRSHPNLSAVGSTMKDAKNAARQSADARGLKKHASSMTSGIVGAVMGTNQFTKAAYSGYKGEADNQSGIDKKRANEAEEKSRHTELVSGQEKISSALENGNLKIDPASIATMAGAIAGAISANGPANPQPAQPQDAPQVTTGPTPVQTAGGTTVTLDNIDVKVNGKATATYDGGLETNITGKATTTYNDGLDVQVAGQANAKYDQGIDVQVNGPANATYDRGIDVQVNGPANAKYDKGIDVQVGGNVSAKYDGNVSAVVGGSSVTTVEGGTNTVVVGDTVTTVGGNTEVNLQDVDVKRNRNNRDSNDA